MALTRRHFGALAATLAAPGVLRAQPQDALYAAARKEGELTWYVVPYPSEMAESMGRRFSERYPGIRVNVVRTTAQVAFQRLNQDLKAGMPACDVFSSTDLAHFLDLKSRQLLLPYTPPSVDQLDRMVQKLDPDGTYHVTTAFPMGLAYNKDKVQGADVPSSWTDLVDPKWRGLAAVAHPGFSGASGAWCLELRKLYGDGFFQKLADNKVHVGRSTIDMVTTVNSGERLISAAPITLAARVAARGNPIGWTVPREGVVMVVSPSAVMAHSRRPNAGRLFMEWLIGSDDVVELGRTEYGIPLRRGLQPPGGLPAWGTVKTLAPTPQQMRDDLSGVVETWKDAFGV